MPVALPEAVIAQAVSPSGAGWPPRPVRAAELLARAPLDAGRGAPARAPCRSSPRMGATLRIAGATLCLGRRSTGESGAIVRAAFLEPPPGPSGSAQFRRPTDSCWRSTSAAAGTRPPVSGV